MAEEQGEETEPAGAAAIRAQARSATRGEGGLGWAGLGKSRICDKNVHGRAGRQRETGECSILGHQIERYDTTQHRIRYTRPLVRALAQWEAKVEGEPPSVYSAPGLIPPSLFLFLFLWARGLREHSIRRSPRT